MADHGSGGFGTAFSSPPRRRQRRPELSQEIVVSAATAILDTEGAAALTFRRLASDLGVGVASLYWYVASREVLLDLALDYAAGQLFTELPKSAKPARTTASWRSRTRAVAVAMYLMYAQRPWAAEQQLASRDRGLNQMRVWDLLGRAFLEIGFTHVDAFNAMSAVLSYVLGYAAQEAAASHSDIDRDAYLQGMGEFMSSLDPAEFPSVAAMGSIFGSHDQRSQFEAGLDMLLDGIAARMPSR